MGRYSGAQMWRRSGRSAVVVATLLGTAGGGGAIDFAPRLPAPIGVELRVARVAGDSVEVGFRVERPGADLVLERSLDAGLFWPVARLDGSAGVYRDALDASVAARFRVAGAGWTPSAPVVLGAGEGSSRAARDAAIAVPEPPAPEAPPPVDAPAAAWVAGYLAARVGPAADPRGAAPPVPTVRARGSARLEVEADLAEPAWVERRLVGRDAVFRRIGRLEPGTLFADSDPRLAAPGTAAEYRLAFGEEGERTGAPSEALVATRIAPRICGVERISDQAARVRCESADPTAEELLLFRRRLPPAGTRAGMRNQGVQPAAGRRSIPESHPAEPTPWEWIAELDPRDPRWIDDELGLGERVVYRVLSGRAGRFLEAGLSPAPHEVGVDAPPDLAVRSGAGRRALLRWSDPVDFERGFVVYRDQGAGARRLAELAPNTTAFVDSTLSGPGPWRYQVALALATGESQPSSAVALRAEVRAPVELRGRLESGARLHLDWRARGRTVTGFVVERRRAGEESFAALDTLGPASTAYVDTLVVPGAEVGYRVRSLGLTHVSAPSRIWRSRIPSMPGVDPGAWLDLGEGCWIARRAVTRAEYRLFCAAAGAPEPARWAEPGGAEGRPADGRLPATDLSWTEAAAYLRWVSGLFGSLPAARRLRMPNAAEWAALIGRPVSSPPASGASGARWSRARVIQDETLFGVRSPLPRRAAEDEGAEGEGAGAQPTGASVTPAREWLDDRYAPGGRALRWRLVADRRGAGAAEPPDAEVPLLPFDEGARYRDLGFRALCVVRGAGG